MPEKRVKYCPNCGAEFIPPQKYCIECGQRLPQSDAYSESTKIDQPEEKLRDQMNKRKYNQSQSIHGENEDSNYQTHIRMNHRPTSGNHRYHQQSIYEQGDRQATDTVESVPENNEAVLWGARIASIVTTISLIIGIFWKFNVFIVIVYIASYLIAKYLVNHSIRLPHREQRIYSMACRIQKLVFTIMIVVVGIHMGLQFILTGIRTTFSYAVSNIYWPSGSTIEMLKRLFQIVL